MVELIFATILAALAFFTGIGISEERYQAKCVEKYAEMPHSEVGDFCKTLLKFEKDPK